MPGYLFHEDCMMRFAPMRFAPVTALCLFALGGGAFAADGEPAQLRLARYTTAAAQPDPALTAPLAVLARVRFPRETVATVGDALSYLLLRTGYRLGETDAAASALLALPLPEAHRQLGPYSARAIASVLVGSAYELQISEVDRRVDVALPAPVREAPASTLAPGLEATLSPLAEAVTVEADISPVELAPLSVPAATTQPTRPAAPPAVPIVEVLP